MVRWAAPISIGSWCLGFEVWSGQDFYLWFKITDKKCIHFVTSDKMNNKGKQGKTSIDA